MGYTMRAAWPVPKTAAHRDAERERDRAAEALAALERAALFTAGTGSAAALARLRDVARREADAARAALKELAGGAKAPWHEVCSGELRRLVAVMDLCGMGYDSLEAELPELAAPDDVEAGEWERIVADIVEHVDNGGLLPPGVPLHLVDTVRAWHGGYERALAAHTPPYAGGDAPPVVPLHKLGGGGGWRVTAAEVRAALEVWDGLEHRRRSSALAQVTQGWPGELLGQEWEEWMGWLRLAAIHDGFTVH